MNKHIWFELISPKGRSYQVLGDPGMDQETYNALGQFCDAVYESECRKKGLDPDANPAPALGRAKPILPA